MRIVKAAGRKGRAEDPRAWPTGGAVRHVLLQRTGLITHTEGDTL
jgi:hypothetical protein